MLTSRRKRHVVKALAAVAAAGLTLPLLSSTPANADPKQFSAFVAVGSDTTQAVIDALAGESNDATYTPIKSSAATGSVQIASWDAIGTPAFPGTCITPKAPGATIVRPNGSGAGKKALSRAIDGGFWGSGTTGTGGPGDPVVGKCGGPLGAGNAGTGKVVSGLINIARSSSGPSTAEASGTDLTYIPFARDGLDFAYYRPSGSPVTSLTKAQLVSLFTTGPQVIGGVNIIPCGIQTSSGTYAAWNTALGSAVTTTNEGTSTATCNNAGTGARLEEHDSAGLKAKGDAIGGASQVIVGMGAGPFISQWNGVAPNRTAAGVDLGTITDNGSGTNIGKPYTGTIGTIPSSLAPVAAYYNDGSFGRNVYNVIDSALLAGPASANQDMKTLLVGSGSAICATGVGSAQAIVQLFGFLTSPICGSTALTGSFVTGTI